MNTKALCSLKHVKCLGMQVLDYFVSYLERKITFYQVIPSLYGS